MDTKADEAGNGVAKNTPTKKSTRRRTILPAFAAREHHMASPPNTSMLIDQTAIHHPIAAAKLGRSTRALSLSFVGGGGVTTVTV